MFGLFKKKQKDDELTAQEKEIFDKGNRMLAQTGPAEYLQNISILMCSNMREVHPVEVYGHIHTCIEIGATGMVSSLAQIAAWKIADLSPEAEEVRKQFEDLAMKSSVDCVSYMKENNITVVYH